MFKQFKHASGSIPTNQEQRRVRRAAIATQTRAAIAAVGYDYIVDTTGHYIAVFRLVGGDVGVVDEQTMATRLRVLEDYLARTPSPIQRLSATYLQPLNSYLGYLSECYQAASTYLPHLCEPIKEVADYLCVARDNMQARLGAEYWVVTYAPRGGMMQGFGGGKSAGPTKTSGTALPLPGQKDNGLWGRIQRAQRAARERAVNELAEQCVLFSLALKRAEIEAQRLSGQELVHLFTSVWQSTFTPPAPASRTAQQAALSEEEMEAQIRTPAGLMELTSTWACTAGGYARSWYLRDFAGALTPDMMNWLAREAGVRVLQYCEQLPMAEARRVLRLNRTIAASERYIRPQGDIPDFDWMVKAQSNDEIRQAMSFNGEPIFRYRAIIQQWARTEEELEERSHALMLSLQDRAQLVVHRATFRQDQALVSGLPLAQCRIEKPERNLNAKSLARLFYPSPRDPLQSEGVWLGMALPSKLMVTMNLFALQNPVVELVGMMGSGKSVTQKFILTQLIAQGYPGFVLDGAREYISTVEALNGTVIRLGSVNGPGFNPVHFDPLDESEEGDPFVVGQALFLDWVEAALHPLSDVEKTVAGEAYMRALEHVGIQFDDRATWENPRPLLSDVYAALMEEQGDPIMGYDNPQMLARKLALALKPFALGVYAPLFNRPDQLALGSEQLVCFDIYDVPDRLRLAFVHQLLAFVQRQTLRRYRFKGSVVVLDEGHLLLHDERSARILEHLVRNGRKAGQLMFFTQHSHTDSQRNSSAQLAHKTAGATLVFRINRQDVATLDDLYLSPLEKQIVVDQNEGECLLVAPSGHVQLKVLIPPAWYPRFTTKPGEVLAQQQAQPEPEPPGPEPSPEPPTVPVVTAPPAEPAPPPPVEVVVPQAPVMPPLPELPPHVPRGEMYAQRALWEQTLVGANQVAPEWLGRGTPVQPEPWVAYEQEEIWERRSENIRLIRSRYADEP